MAASYFDLDGTLVGTNLVHPTLFYLLNQPTPFATLSKVGRALLNAPRMAIAELVDRRTFNELLFESYAGTSEDRLVLLADEAFEKVIRPSMYRSSLGLIQKSRDAGHEIVLLSGALDVILRHVADYVGGATSSGTASR